MHGFASRILSGSRHPSPSRPSHPPTPATSAAEKPGPSAADPPSLLHSQGKDTGETFCRCPTISALNHCSWLPQHPNTRETGAELIWSFTELTWSLPPHPLWAPPAIGSFPVPGTANSPVCRRRPKKRNAPWELGGLNCLARLGANKEDASTGSMCFLISKAWEAVDKAAKLPLCHKHMPAWIRVRCHETHS